MKIFKYDETAELPKFATENSACFDLKACFNVGDKITIFNPFNKKMELPAKLVSGKTSLYIHPNTRMMVPTGLIFDIPKNYFVEIYPRSGLSLKSGINLVNNVGVVDEDYIDPVYVLIQNVSDTPFVLSSGDRIAQARLVKTETYKIEESKTRPVQKTDRVGGFGSTGVSDSSDTMIPQIESFTDKKALNAFASEHGVNVDGRLNINEMKNQIISKLNK